MCVCVYARACECMCVRARLCVLLCGSNSNLSSNASILLGKRELFCFTLIVLLLSLSHGVDSLFTVRIIAKPMSKTKFIALLQRW